MTVFEPEGKRMSSNVTWLVRIARVRGLVYSFSGRGMPKGRSFSQETCAFRACSSPSGVSFESAVYLASECASRLEQNRERKA